MNHNGNEVHSNNAKVGAVMVIGGGISGMQSALDLADSGFKVYLVDEATSIGGRMSQLDKTFPTNDCSMCMISPKLIEVGKHNNIELITNAQVETVQGEEGNFQVNVLKRPRYIDEDKCSGCGDCVEACPVIMRNEFEEGLNTRKATYRRYPQAIPGSMAISKINRPPCKLNCPAGCNGQGYIALISQGKYLESFNLIKQRIPLPASLGRICDHPCELQCNRNQVEESISIAALKRFAAHEVQKQRKEGLIPPQEKAVLDPSKAKVAIIGSGPSGLTCADDLAKLGYPVTIFEANSKPGGQLQLTIPEYRLPKDILATEIQDIIDTGIELKLNTRIGEDVTLENLKTQGYKAIYLAIGAQKSTSLSIPGEDLPGVLPALDFLRDVNLGKETKIGNKVVVIGGGNVAIDAARTAVRLGAKEVCVIYRRTESEMPALHEEVEDAREEGIKFQFLTNPKQFLSNKNDQLVGVECNEMELGEPDESGRRRPIAKPDTFTVECDMAITAIGQSTDLAVLLAKTLVKTQPNGFIAADPVTLSTDEPGIFAGGDGFTGPRSAVEAINQGHEAAVSIERYLTGADLLEDREQDKEEPAPLLDGEYKKNERIKARRIPLDKRLFGFDEVDLGYTEEEARAETERCLDCGLCSECLQCVEVCQASAIDHTMEEELLQIPVGSIVFAPGFEPFDASIKGEYGYGRMPNVVNSLEFERILSASGPFQGQVLRPSDNQHPTKVAWIQCVGSRDKLCNHDYCSSVCCMYATKQAIIAREHDSNIQPTIFYNDIRAFGKGFERYYESAKNKFGVRYIKYIPSAVKELQQSNNLLLEYINEDGQKVQEEFDVVVLSIGLVPSASAIDLARRLNIDLDNFGFCQTNEFQPNVTSRSGIYVAGAFDSPMDIPESVISASSAACLASQAIAEARGTMVTEKVYPDELDVGDQEPRIGVFVCRCGTNIARVVDVPNLAEYAETLPYVVHSEENLYTCSTDTQNRLIEIIKEKGLNRVVVASCSPRTHEPLFQDTIREAGLNKFLFEMANIRDQCSWVHAEKMPEATEKAKDLVLMAVARAATLKPLHQSPAEIKHGALIIGGGLSGIIAALSVAKQGYEAVIVEREKELGGNLRHVYYTENGDDPKKLLNEVVSKLEAEPKVKVYKSAKIKDISGFLGNYKTEIITDDGNSEIYEHGVVIVATGGIEYKPKEYLYGQSDKVITQSELEEKVSKDTGYIKGLNSVVMIQCVGSREEEHMYCSRICCTQAMKNARKLKEQNPDIEVTVLYRDIRTYGMHELSYQEARNRGVIFAQYDADRKPEITEENNSLKVKVFDNVLRADIVLEPDLVVLSAAIRPQPDAEELASKLKLPLTVDKFFMEAHMKLRPFDFVNEGMYLCGLAHSPKLLSESIAQARGAVSRAMTVLSKPYLMVGGIVSVVNPDQCVGCLTCVRSCPFNVPTITEEGVADIEAAACQGCGICTGACPRKAISLQHYSDEQVIAKINALASA
jgi:heterodisulfide reductase subunit A-like polyferredoxin